MENLTNIQRENALILAAHLRTLKSEELDQTNWFCGTKACALGHATRIQHFKDQGLRAVLVDGKPEEVILSGSSHFDNYGMSAAYKLFGSSMPFGVDGDERDYDPHMVADELETLALS